MGKRSAANELFLIVLRKQVRLLNLVRSLCADGEQGGAVATPSDAILAVEAAVRSLENNAIFNAGIGSSLTSDGKVEMDAIISMFLPCAFLPTITYCSGWT